MTSPYGRRKEQRTYMTQYMAYYRNLLKQRSEKSREVFNNAKKLSTFIWRLRKKIGIGQEYQIILCDQQILFKEDIVDILKRFEELKEDAPNICQEIQQAFTLDGKLVNPGPYLIHEHENGMTLGYYEQNREKDFFKYYIIIKLNNNKTWKNKQKRWHEINVWEKIDEEMYFFRKKVIFWGPPQGGYLLSQFLYDFFNEECKREVICEAVVPSCFKLLNSIDDIDVE